MMRIGVIPAPNATPATIKCLRRHTDLPISELRARLAETTPIIDFPQERDILTAVRRCRDLLRDLDAVSATIRVWESFNGSDGMEVSRELLHNWMRTLIRIAKEVRDDTDREAAADEG